MAQPPRLRLWADRGTKRPGPTGTGAGSAGSHRSSGLLDPGCEVLNEVVHRSILRDQTGDLTRRVDHGGVVAAAELLADLGQRRVRELAREVHRDLPRVGDRLRAALAAELGDREPEPVGHRLLDAADRDRGYSVAVWKEVAQDRLGELDRE